MDPRVEWKTLQEEMLRSYLATAESDLKAKQELVDIKQQRLHLAQHDLNHLNTTLSTLSTSTTSRKLWSILGKWFKIKILKLCISILQIYVIIMFILLLISKCHMQQHHLHHGGWIEETYHLLLLHLIALQMHHQDRHPFHHLLFFQFIIQILTWLSFQFLLQ